MGFVPDFLPNIALHPTRARKVVCLLRFPFGRGRVSFTLGIIRDMSLSIEIPTLTTILEKGIPVVLAPCGCSWSELPLGEQRNEIGVYVIHHNGAIKYVGKTNGRKMSFGMRLRRHFQESAAGEHTYPRFAKIDTPPKIQVSLFSLNDIKKFVTFEREIQEPWLTGIVPLFESALIVALEPEFQNQSE